MAYSNNIITDPVSISDVQAAVSHTSGDLATLITAGTINMWAKYKPVIRTTIDTTGQLKSDKTWKKIGSPDYLQSTAWFKSDNQNYGIVPKAYYIDTTQQRTIKALEQLAADIKNRTNELNGWQYQRPAGGSSQPFRLVDFNRYKQNAPKPVVRCTGQSSVTASETSTWFYAVEIMGSAYSDVSDDIDERDYIRLNDIMSGIYPGIAIFRLVNGVYKAMAWCTGNIWYGTGIKSSGEGVTLGDYNVRADFVNGGTYYVIPVIFGESLEQVDLNDNPAYGYSKQPRYTTGGQPYVWSVPNTNFISFTASQRSTSQAIALPRVNPTEIGQVGNSGYYRGSVLLDSTVAGYSGSNERTIAVRYALVTSAWSGSLVNMSSNEFVPGSLYDWTGVVPNNTVLTLKDFTGPNALIGLSLQESYRWAISVDGEMTVINLRVPYNPNI